MDRRFSSVALAPLLLLATSCTFGQAAEMPTPTQSLPSMSTSTSASGGTSTGATATDDLKTGRTQHVIRSSGVTATVYYETRKPAEDWTAGGEKPLRVEVRVSRPKKKVYLTRVTLRFSVNDGSSEIPGPDPLVDAASNITPGYLVTPPYSYVQSFAIPTVDVSTRGMTIDVKLELVSLVDAKAKDYTKQTVTDQVHTVIDQ
jgi:hypothetical protein